MGVTTSARNTAGRRASVVVGLAIAGVVCGCAPSDRRTEPEPPEPGHDTRAAGRTSYPYVFELRGGPEMAASVELGRVDEAFERYDVDALVAATGALVERFPDDPAARALRAGGLSILLDREVSQANVERLRAALDDLREVDPDSPYPALLQAYVHRSSGRPDRALTLYAAVLGRDDLTDSARSWTLRQRSFAELQTGAIEDARADAERAVALDPSDAGARFALSRVLEAAGDLEGAIRESGTAVELDPLEWRHRQRHGLVLTRAGRAERGIAFLEEACRTSAFQEACANVAVSLERFGKPARARDAARHAASLGDSPWGLYNLACYRSLAGDADGAIETLERAVELGFGDALIERDGDLDPLRGRPGFTAVVGRVDERVRARRALLESAFPFQ